MLMVRALTELKMVVEPGQESKMNASRVGPG